MLKAITRQARLVDAKVAAHNKALPSHATQMTIAHFFDHLATEEDTNVMVVEEDFEMARRELVPSVSAEELGHYEGVRKAFEGEDKKKVEEKKNKQSQLVGNGKGAVGLPGDMAKRRTSSSTTTGGKKVLKFANEATDGENGDVEEEEDDDPYTIRTGHLAVNGIGHQSNGSHVSSKGKGKGKGVTSGFGDAAGDDEDLYG
jgi:peroxin-6